MGRHGADHQLEDTMDHEAQPNRAGGDSSGSISEDEEQTMQMDPPSLSDTADRVVSDIAEKNPTGSLCHSSKQLVQQKVQKDQKLEEQKTKESKWIRNTYYHIEREPRKIYKTASLMDGCYGSYQVGYVVSVSEI